MLGLAHVYSAMPAVIHRVITECRMKRYRMQRTCRRWSFNSLQASDRWVSLHLQQLLKDYKASWADDHRGLSSVWAC